MSTLPNLPALERPASASELRRAPILPDMGDTVRATLTPRTRTVLATVVGFDAGSRVRIRYRVTGGYRVSSVPMARVTLP